MRFTPSRVWRRSAEAQVDNLRIFLEPGTQVNNLRHIMEIDGRGILVTGASRGLGYTLAFAFAKAGAREVFAGARQPADIEKLKRGAAAIGLPITPIKLDVTIDEDIHAATGLGFINILVNNAGIAGYGNPAGARRPRTAAERR